MEGQQAPVAAVHRQPRRPKDNCRPCRKCYRGCINGIASSDCTVLCILILPFILSIAVLGFTGTVGKYFLTVANAWRNGLSGLTMMVCLLAMVAAKARFQNVLFLCGSIFHGTAWGYFVVASFDGGQMVQLYQRCNDLYNSLPSALQQSWKTCPYFGSETPQQIELQSNGLVGLGLAAACLWGFTGAVVNRRGTIIADEIEGEQKLFDSLQHVGAAPQAVAVAMDGAPKEAA